MLFEEKGNPGTIVKIKVEITFHLGNRYALVGRRIQRLVKEGIGVPNLKLDKTQGPKLYYGHKTWEKMPTKEEIIDAMSPEWVFYKDS